MVQLVFLVGLEGRAHFAQGKDPIEGLLAIELTVEATNDVLLGAIVGCQQFACITFHDLPSLEHQQQSLLFAQDRGHHQSG